MLSRHKSAFFDWHGSLIAMCSFDTASFYYLCVTSTFLLSFLVYSYFPVGIRVRNVSEPETIPRMSIIELVHAIKILSSVGDTLMLRNGMHSRDIRSFSGSRDIYVPILWLANWRWPKLGAIDYITEPTSISRRLLSSIHPF